ncbi:MAG TPA: DUF4399 domain-containing protein [Aquabacterium sp.]|uniref:DUF4399 domain-containing protein n=1 Tax=Aquabacterium sp. TaxID=1872578 RepID=UPI002E342173|nr:DUF4399 domain-containing protein [Aquabacterium sp.]HEX5371164.1 DUF4399 domain-containing protein [Aquabacterium sp.]
MNTHFRSLLTRSLLTLATASLPWGMASAATANEPPSHPWVTAPPRGLEPENYITNLKDGDKIETPYVLRFGLSQYGLSGISAAVPRTGHHHLLINRDLPLDFTKPLPFTTDYVHFGKGQMETVLSLKPGTYTLRMLLADHKHIPLFIYSPKLTITVTAQRSDIKPESLLKPGVSILAPRDGETVKAPVLMRLHASQLNISHDKITANDAGHFRLVFRRTSDGATESVDFRRGQTELWLRPPAGTYRVQTQFVHNGTSQVRQRSAEQTLIVR